MTHRSLLLIFFLIICIPATLAVTGCRSDSGKNDRRNYVHKDMELTVGSSTIEIAVVDNGQARQKGLMNVPYMNEEQGMLFVFPDEQRRSFWMKNTLIPLDIAFLNKEGVILNIRQMQPHDESSQPSAGPAMYALEMNEGWFALHGIKVGDTIPKLPPRSEQ